MTIFQCNKKIAKSGGKWEGEQGRSEVGDNKIHSSPFTPCPPPKHKTQNAQNTKKTNVTWGLLFCEDLMLFCNMVENFFWDIKIWKYFWDDNLMGTQ